MPSSSPTTTSAPRCKTSRISLADSLGLSRQAASTDAATVVFAGVHFMAETAKILAPDKTVLLPELRAGCPMADMVTGEQLREWKAENPGVAVVTYVNSSAEVKAESDVCVTSANAVAVVQSLGAEKILFPPDRNLGSWVARSLPGVEVALGDCWCRRRAGNRRTGHGCPRAAPRRRR